MHWEYVDKTRGTWKVDRWWRRRVGTRPGNDPGRPDPAIDHLDLKGRTCIRMPGQLRVAFSHWVHYEFYVPEDANHHRYVQFAVHFGRGRRAVGWLAQYLFFLRPVFHGQFTGQDSWMVHVMGRATGEALPPRTCRLLPGGRWCSPRMRRRIASSSDLSDDKGRRTERAADLLRVILDRPDLGTGGEAGTAHAIR